MMDARARGRAARRAGAPRPGARDGAPRPPLQPPARGTQRPAAVGAPAAYLRGGCRAGRRGSARIPGLSVLPLSPCPSIQLGLFPRTSPCSKSEERRPLSRAAEHRPLAPPAGAASREARRAPAPGRRPARPPPRSPASITGPAPARSGFSAARGAAAPALGSRGAPPSSLAPSAAPPAPLPGPLGRCASEAAVRVGHPPRPPAPPMPTP